MRLLASRGKNQIQKISSTQKVRQPQSLGIEFFFLGIIQIMKLKFQQAALGTYIISLIPMYIGVSQLNSGLLIFFGLTMIILSSIITVLTT